MGETSTPSRILMLCDWLPPDFGAVGQYAISFAHNLAADGHEVCLSGFTSNGASVDESRVGSGRLKVRRVAVPIYDKSKIIKRAVWTILANVQLLWKSRREIISSDEIRFTGSPPYIVHFLMPICVIMGKRTRYRITDFHPECLIATKGGRPGYFLGFLSAVTNFWRRRVSVMEVLGNDQRRRLSVSGVDESRIVLVRDPSPVDKNQFLEAVPYRPAAAGQSLVILYSGNWGVAHDYRTFVEGYSKFHEAEPGEALLWMNAVGAKADLVQSHLDSLTLPLIRTNPVPLSELASVLKGADVHLITLRDEFVGYVMPSKVYACISSGRPVLFIGSEKSDVHELCSEYLSTSHYRRVDVGDALGVSEALSFFLRSKGVNDVEGVKIQ